MYLHPGNVGEVLRDLRSLRGMKANELAKLSEVNQGFLSRIENGKADPSLRTICKLLDALDAQLVVLTKEDPYSQYRL